MSNLETAQEIDKIARVLLKDSKAWGKFPTPVDDIVKYAQLTVEKGIDLSKAQLGFFDRFASVPRLARKVLGMLDYRQKIIYLDHSQKPQKKRFIKLHEVVHEVCPWQRDIRAFLDDESTLDLETEEIFEAEANYGASSLFFQLEIFDEHAEKLPLTIKS